MSISTLVKYNDFEKILEIDWTKKLGDIVEKLLQICHLMIYNVESFLLQNPQNGSQCYLGSEEAQFNQSLPPKFLDKNTTLEIVIIDRLRDSDDKVLPENSYHQAYTRYQQEKADLDFATSMQHDINYEGYGYGEQPPTLHSLINLLRPPAHIHDDSEEDVDEDDMPGLQPAFTSEAASALLSLQNAITLLSQLNQPSQNNMPQNAPINNAIQNMNDIVQSIQNTFPNAPQNIPIVDTPEDGPVDPIPVSAPVSSVPAGLQNLINSFPGNVHTHTFSFDANSPDSFPIFLQEFATALGNVNMPLGEDVKVSLTKDELLQQNTSTYREYLDTSEYNESPFQEESCNICLEDYRNEDNIMIFKCQHYYHKKCVETWLSSNSNKCPICKVEIAKGKPNIN